MISVNSIPLEANYPQYILFDCPMVLCCESHFDKMILMFQRNTALFTTSH